MANLADILVTLTLDTSEFTDGLRRAGQQMNDFRNHVRQQTLNLSGDFDTNLGSMVNSLENLSTSTQATTASVSDSLENVADSTRSVSRTSRNLARTLGTSMRDSRRVLVAGTQEFRNFGEAGRRVSMEIRQEFSALPRHLQSYVQRLREAGESTASFARLNELYGARVVESMRRTNDYMQNRTMQSTRLIQHLNGQSMMGLSQQFLRLGQRMEDTARRGSALNLALTRLGENASLREIQDEMRFIQQGVARARSNLLLMGIATGIAVYGLIKLSNAVDGRLLPAFEELKSVWADALTPFVKAFTTFLVWVMKGATAVGELMKKFAEAHPQLSQMLWGILLLTLAIGTLLSPLAIGIGLTGGLSAGFAALWTTIAPFVLGFLTVAGIALIVATALVTVIAVVNNLLKHSEAFKNSWTNLWNGVKTAFTDAFVKPVSEAWENLKTAFGGLIATFTGGEGTMSNLWKFLGDKIAIAVNFIAGVVLPILKGAFAILASVVVGVINGIIVVVNWLGLMWKKHGDEITSVMTVIWGVISTAFNAVSDYVKSIMPQIKSTISSAFELIKTIIDFTMKYIAPVVVGAFKVIWEIIKFVMPFILNIIVSVWNNIKNVISATIGIVQGVIKLFTSILKGDWSGAWDAVWSILTNVVKLVWNLIQLYFLGKFLSPLKGFASAGMGIIKGAWTGFLNIIKSILTNTKAFIVGVWNAIKSSLSGSFTGIKNLAVNTFNALKSTVSSIFNGVKSTATTIWNGIKNAITKPIESAKKTVLGIISAIVGAFAGMKISMPNIRMPKVGITEGKKTLFGKEFSYPKFDVQWNAKGGIFNGASILGGGQGVAEKGAEAVLPIQHKRYMKPFASAVASHLSSGSESSSGGNQYIMQFNEPIVVREEADIHRISRELFKLIDKRGRGNGRK